MTVNVIIRFKVKLESCIQHYFKTRFIPSMRQVHAGVGVGVRNLVLDRNMHSLSLQYTCILDEYVAMQTSLDRDYKTCVVRTM